MMINTNILFLIELSRSNTYDNKIKYGFRNAKLIHLSVY